MSERPTCEICKWFMKKNGTREYKDGSIAVRYRCSTCGYTCEEKYPKELEDKLRQLRQNIRRAEKREREENRKAIEEMTKRLTEK